MPLLLKQNRRKHQKMSKIMRKKNKLSPIDTKKAASKIERGG